MLLVILHQTGNIQNSNRNQINVTYMYNKTVKAVKCLGKCCTLPGVLVSAVLQEEVGGGSVAVEALKVEPP